MFSDWPTMVVATLDQAVRFELAHEARPEEDRAVVHTWFKVMRVRVQQNSVEKKLAKRAAAVAATAVAATAESQGDGKTTKQEGAPSNEPQE